MRGFKFRKKERQAIKYVDNPREMPGFLKKSFSLFYHGGEIWFEHLDGMYGYEELVLEKLDADLEVLFRPSTSGYVCVNVDETIITDRILNRLLEIFDPKNKRFVKVCFVGLNRTALSIVKKNLSQKGIMVGFIDDFEKAKEWLI